MPTVTRDRYDALVLDLDGTLLDRRGKLSEPTRRAVRRARDAGYLVVIATGRSLSGARAVHQDLGLDTALCAYNGAWIGPAGGGAPWHYAPIPDEVLAHVEGIERRARWRFRHQGDHKYTHRADHPEHRRLATWFHNVVQLDDPSHALPSRDLVRVSVFFDGEAASEEAWRALSDEAREVLHRETFPLAIFPDFEDVGLVLCEVQRRGRGKAEALRWLEEERGVPASRVVAAGDQANDVPMLEKAGLAVAMGNAIPAVRDVADVVIGDHGEEGLSRWLDGELI